MIPEKLPQGRARARLRAERAGYPAICLDLAPAGGAGTHVCIDTGALWGRELGGGVSCQAPASTNRHVKPMPHRYLIGGLSGGPSTLAVIAAGHRTGATSPSPTCIQPPARSPRRSS